MRFYEFAKPLLEDKNNGKVDNLTSVLNLIRFRIEKEKLGNDYSTDTIINLVRNSGNPSFSYGDLVKEYETNSSVQALISKPEKDRIEFLSGEETIEPMPDAGLDLDNDQSMGTDLTEPQDAGLEMDAMSGGRQPIAGSSSNQIPGPQGTEQTVKSMAKKALKRRID